MSNLWDTLRSMFHVFYCVSWSLEHEQIKLFPKRDFVCDCPTKAFTHTPAQTKCTLNPAMSHLPLNAVNKYGQNFEGGKFCWCHRTYDHKRERETMVQCLVCEDWFHESRLNLRERVPSRSPSPEPPVPPEPNTTNQADATAEDGKDQDSECSEDPSLPPALLLICGGCVLGNPLLRKYAGTPGAQMVVRESGESGWVIIGQLEDPVDGANEDVELSDAGATKNDDAGASAEVVPPIGTKRARSPSPDRPPKRARKENGSESDPNSGQNVTSSSCCIPQQTSPLVRDFLSGSSSTLGQNEKGAADIFLVEGWRDRWCKCSNCLPLLQAQPYLLDEEQTYEPPEDADSQTSLEELSMRALQSLPRDRALDGIHAYNTMRDELLLYLKPFARQGGIVTESDINEFFEAKRAGKEAGGSGGGAGK